MENQPDNNWLNQFILWSFLFKIAFGGFGFGCGLAWTATALPDLEESRKVGDLLSKEKSWIGSLLAIGALIGCPIAGYLMGGHSRRSCLWFFSAIGFTGWVLLACATSPIYLYFGRIITGMSTGGYTIIVPVFVSEISSKENRGLIGSLFLVMICLGKLFSNVIGIIFSANFASVLCAAHPLLYGIFLFLIPDSPPMLMRLNKIKDAYKSLSWLESTGFTGPFCTYTATNFNGSREVSSKLENIKLGNAISSSNSDESNVTLKEFFSSPELVKPFLIVLAQMLLSQFCGINAATFYTVEIFQLSGRMMIDPKLATVIVSAIQTVGCLACSIFVDRYGRRLLLMSSFLAMALSMGGFTSYFYIRDAYTTLLTDYPYLSLTPLVSLVIYNLAFCWGAGSVAWIVVSEILQPKIIRPASTVANAIFWGAAFLITQAFQMFKDDIPVHFWFLGFAIVSLLGFLFNKLYLPETKGRTLEEIEAFFIKK